MYYVPSSYRRLAAYIIDSLITSFFYIPLALQIFYGLLQNGMVEVHYKWIVLTFMLVFSYKWFFYKLMGATIGKLILNLRLVPAAHPDRELGWFQAFLRVLTDHFSIFFGIGLQSLMLLRLDRTHVSDWVAETRVVQKTERAKPAKRRVLTAMFLCLYFSLNAFISLYKTIKPIHFSTDRIIIYKTN